MTNTPIVVVGAGLAGTLLAAVLIRSGLPTVVLERESGPGARAQGGSLDLHPDSGQQALKEVGLMRGFRRRARPEGAEIRVLDPQGRQHVHHAGPAPQPLDPDLDEVVDGRPEIDRAELRELVLGVLPPGTVRWGSHVVDVRRRAGGGHRVTLADGATLDAAVLVGADGAWSWVRPLLTPVGPTPLGIDYAELWLRDLDRHPELDALVGAGSLWCLGGGLNVGAQRVASGAARVSVMRRGPLPDDRAGLLAVLDDWSPTITALLAHADEDVVLRRLATLPAGLTWTTQPDVTLLGDAAHLMPPVGEGANQALLDGAELGRLLVESPDDPAAAIAAYETGLHARVTPIHEESDRIQELLIGPDALSRMVAMFSGPQAA